MKKILFAVATIAAIMISFSSCKVEEEEGNKNLLLKTWKLSQSDTCDIGYMKSVTTGTADYFARENPRTETPENYLITFNANGTYNYSGNLVGSGTWVYQYVDMKKNNSVLKLDNDPYKMMEVTTLNDSTLVLMSDYHFDKKTGITFPTIRQIWKKKK